MDTLIQVSSIDIRERIPQTVILQLVNEIVNECKPEKIVLFGSYAYGIPKPESDLDLLIVMNTSKREIEEALRIRKAIAPTFGVDLIVLTPNHLAQRLEWGDSFLREVTQRGKVLYESNHA